MAEQKILGFAGSLRAGSYNRLLLRAAAEVAPDRMTIETFDLTPIPLYNQDLDLGEGPQAVARFREAIDRADGVLIATPEYQHGLSGVLKNALDWASRPPGRSVLRGKPVAMMGASPGRVGTARAHMQLREILLYVEAQMVVVPEVLVAHAPDKFDDKGSFTDEVGRRFMRQLLENLAAAITASGTGIISTLR